MHVGDAVAHVGAAAAAAVQCDLVLLDAYNGANRVPETMTTPGVIMNPPSPSSPAPCRAAYMCLHAVPSSAVGRIALHAWCMQRRPNALHAWVAA